jgi:hypothetical protein
MGNLLYWAASGLIQNSLGRRHPTGLADCYLFLRQSGLPDHACKQFIFNTYTELLKDVEAKPGMTKTEAYEEWAKGLFIKEPANMKLLVVVDKLDASKNCCG